MSVSNLSQYGADYFLSVLTGQSSIVSTYYVALTLDTPDDFMDGVTLANIEVTGGGYQRVAIPVSGAYWETPDGGSVSNSQDINFPTPTTDWGAVTSYAVCDAPEYTGNVLFFGDFDEDPQFVSAGVQVQILAGQITMGLTGLTQAVVS